MTATTLYRLPHNMRRALSAMSWRLRHVTFPHWLVNAFAAIKREASAAIAKAKGAA